MTWIRLIGFAFALVIGSGALARSVDCAQCHAQEHQDWLGSHHAQAMAAAESALAPVYPSAVKATEPSAASAPRLEQGEQGLVLVTAQGAWPISHTFGLTPLQQYLTPTGKGRSQVLPWAWDSRAKSAGGQRWLTLGTLDSADRLHWQQPLFNWNGMCADCHATNLMRNYDDGTDAFRTTYAEQGVGCVACHALDAQHPQGATGQKQRTLNPAPRWVLGAAADTAKLQSTQADSRDAMDVCFGCHSLREPLTDGFQPGTAYLDQFSPSLPIAPWYFADGQIKEEVYVYGSFLQSKMYVAGVQCSNCHEPHSARLRIEGDGLCAQCHRPTTFASVAHTGHAPTSPGARCVGCHMPQTTYMQVDARRDHSFSIPRPELTLSHAIPNACSRCHTDTTASWAQAQLDNWHGVSSLSDTKRKVVHALTGDPVAAPELRDLLRSPTVPPIMRAALLSARTELAPPAAAFVSNEPLVVLAAIAAAERLPRMTLGPRLVPLLSHPLRVVRVEAAAVLVAAGLASRLGSQAESDMNNVLPELALAAQVSTWRGEGRMNRALLAIGIGAGTAAEKDYAAAIKLDPYFAPAYVNLADLMRQSGRDEAALALLHQGLERVPNAAILNYALAMNLVRGGEHQRALEFSHAAVLGEPDSARFALAYVLLLDASKQLAAALDWLKSNLERYPGARDLHSSAQALARKAGDTAALSLFKSLGKADAIDRPPQTQPQ